MDLGLKGKVALVTGGSKGIGGATAIFSDGRRIVTRTQPDVESRGNTRGHPAAPS